jgi:hypothetical protein
MRVTLKIPVSYDHDSLVRNKLHCPIANSIVLANEDFLWVVVDRNTIAVSRRSTNQRYFYRTPSEARDYIDAVDRGEHPADFVLKLGEPFRVRGRTKRSATKAVRAAAVKARGGPIKPKPADVSVAISSPSDRETVLTTDTSGKTKETTRKQSPGRPQPTQSGRPQPKPWGERIPA